MDQRIISAGMGEHHPIADNSTPEGRQANRRVEITLVPVTAG
jgi:outer membrane protein OmpA-like peptidoglycan-associated protein